VNRKLENQIETWIESLDDECLITAAQITWYEDLGLAWELPVPLSVQERCQMSLSYEYFCLVAGEMHQPCLYPVGLILTKAAATCIRDLALVEIERRKKGTADF
jgi:hypothetical protein